MPTRIQIRRGTSAQWAATNPVLASGEEGLDTDTGDRRIGDGTTAWASLRKGPVGKGDQVVNVRDYGVAGDGSTNDRAAINACIAANPGKVILFPAGRTYKINADQGTPTSGYGGGITLNQAGTTLDLRGATITMVASSSTHYQMIDVTAADCRILGGRLVGDVGSHVGSTGEFGYGISIGAGAHRLLVDGTCATKCWGDGFFIWDDPADVELRSCTSDDNRRNGLSIIDATRPRVIGGAYVNTGRTAFTAPAAGICIEPDTATTRDVIDALVSGVTLSNNVGYGLLSVSNGRTVTAQIVGCRATTTTGVGFQIEGIGNVTTLVGCEATGGGNRGFYIADNTTGISLKDCSAVGNLYQGFYVLGDRASLQACRATQNGDNGFQVHVLSDRAQLIGCSGLSNSQTASGSPDFDIYGTAGLLTGCVSDAGALTNKPGYGFFIRTGATTTKIRGCLATGSYVTGTYSDSGTSTSVDTAP